MARLNEPPQMVENLEAIKRSLLRKNRDLTKSHAAQQIRNRTLEDQLHAATIEISNLRQDLISSRAEVERQRRTDLVSAEVQTLRDDLQKKISEFSAFVAQMGGIPQKIREKERTERRQSRMMGKVSSPTKASWYLQQQNLPSQREPDQHMLGIDESRAITRFSFGTEDLQPEVHMDEIEDQDPPYISSAEPESTEDQTDQQAPSGQPQPTEDFVLQNIEQRRKRRTSSLVADLDIGNVEVGIKFESEADDGTAKRSTKRKLDVASLDRESERGIKHAVFSEDFAFQRKPASKPVVTSRKSNRFSRPLDRQMVESVPTDTSSPNRERKALAPKSTNSPTKKSSSLKGIEHKPSRDETDKARKANHSNLGVAQGRRRPAPDPQPSRPAVSSVSHVEPPVSQPSRQASIHGTDEIDVPPKTPLLSDDILSPQTSEPSEPPNRRMKQEAVIQNSLEDVLNGSIGRASRRAKTAVSYAEPSLRDKMRRPGKELVGAVEGYERKHRESGSGLERSQAGESERKTERWTGAAITSEEAPSPLREKQIANTKRSRETIDIQRWATGDDQLALPPILDSHMEHSTSSLEKGPSGLSIFDHPVSSPNETKLEDQSSEVSASTATTANASEVKRPSRVSTSTSRTARDVFSGRAKNSSSKTVVPPLPLSAVRPSTTLSNLASTTQRTRPPSSSLRRSSSASVIRHRRRESADSALSTSTNGSTSDVEDGSDEETIKISLAAENVQTGSMRATRRRSMVV